MCGSPPDAPQLPAFPGLTPDETANLQKQGVTLDQFQSLINGTSTALDQNKQILQQVSGLYDAQGNIDQTKLGALRDAASKQLAQAQGVGSAALGYLQNYFGGGTDSSGTTPDGAPTGAPGTTSVAGAQSEAYLNVLNGTGAVNQATKDQQQRDFIALKDSAAQRGIMITGDTPEQATSSSTAGQRMIQNFQTTTAAANSQERLGYIQTLGGQVAGTVGAAQASAGTGAAATNTAMGYSTGAATQSAATLSPLLTQFETNLQSNYQPYLQQQLGPYQQALNQANMNYTAGLNQYQATEGQTMGWANLAGTFAGAAAGYAGSSKIAAALA